MFFLRLITRIKLLQDGQIAKIKNGLSFMKIILIENRDINTNVIKTKRGKQNFTQRTQTKKKRPMYFH